MDENKNPILKKEELTDETLEQVSGGVNLPLNMGANESSSEAASSAAAVDPMAIPAGITAGAAIMIGGAWVVIDHQQPSKKANRHMPTPTPERDPRSM